MYMLNGWWFLSFVGSCPPVFMVELLLLLLLFYIGVHGKVVILGHKQYMCL